jgi:hypothetical protein
MPAPQVDTGFLEIERLGKIVGLLNAKASGEETFLLFPATASGVNAPYVPPSAANPDVTIRYRFLSPPLTVFPPTNPAGSTITKTMPLGVILNEGDDPGGMTGSALDSSITHSQTLMPGRYKLFQGALEVGRVIVEPAGGDTLQHWFMFMGTSNPPAPGKGAYIRPGSLNPDVTIQYVRIGNTPPGALLKNLIDDLNWHGQRQYNKDDMNFVTTTLDGELIASPPG